MFICTSFCFSGAKSDQTTTQPQPAPIKGPSVILKEPPKSRNIDTNQDTNVRSDNVQSQPVKISAQMPTRKQSEPVPLKKTDNNQSNSVNNNINNTLNVKVKQDTPKLAVNSGNGDDAKSVNSSAVNVAVDKNSKDMSNSKKVEDSKEQLSTPKKERYIPPLPKSASKYVIIVNCNHL